MIIPTALGTGPVAHVTPRCVIPTRALENHVFIAYSNYTGPSAGSSYEASYVGQSAIVGPDGIDLARASGTEVR